ncbi:MAG: DUF2089 domain-containing protein [Chloroflexota bacterium]
MPYPVLGRCPVCAEALEVTRLECRHCGSAIEGHFELGRLARLAPEQIAFVETFVRCEGRLNRMEDELGVSYPTVRNRLNEVIRALGYAVDEEPALSADDRRAILDQLAAGAIDSAEALRLLKVKS